MYYLGGGADDVNNGNNCEDAFLRTSLYEEANWTLISFNFGLHDLYNDSKSEAEYEVALTNFTNRLLKTSSKLVFISTTPYMPYRYYGNTVVEDLNAIAQRVVSKVGIPYADLYHHITAYCGAVYSFCDICDNESSFWPANSPPGANCGYHYTDSGYAYISEFLSPIFAGILNRIT